MKKNNFHFSKIGLAALALLLAAACAAPIAITNRGPEDAAKNVLIASQPSEFKKAIIEKVSVELGASGMQIKTIPLKQAQEERIRDYDAVLVINSCMAWSLSKDAGKFVESAKDKEKKQLYIFTTAANPKYTQKLPEGFDGITSASDMAKVDTLTATLVENIKKRASE